jgi:FkbM family methyltransferase
MIARLAEQGRELVWCTSNKLMWWRRLHTPGLRPSMQMFGDRVRYQWPIIANSLDARSIVYSFGIGRNATFELDAIACTGCQVFAFDPTPRSAEWAREQHFPRGFRFLEFGIADADGEIEFHQPPNPSDISYSAHIKRTEGSMSVRAPVRCLSSFMGMLGHETIDLLKMDVEGCEYTIISQLAASALRPDQFLVEFHHGFYGFTPDETRAAVRTLCNIGYEVFWVSSRGLEYGFVHREAGLARQMGRTQR